MRSHYSYKPHKSVAIMGCSTCKYSRLRFNKETEGENKCIGAKMEDIGDGMIRITSRCSGQSFIYPKETIVDFSNKRGE